MVFIGVPAIRGKRWGMAGLDFSTRLRGWGYDIDHPPVGAFIGGFLESPL